MSIASTSLSDPSQGQHDVEMTTRTFYGTKTNARPYSKEDIQWRRKIRKIAKEEEHLKQHPCPKPYKALMTQPGAEWKLFYRQNDAFQFARGKSQAPLHVFAFESQHAKVKSGQRLYLVTSYQQFWHHYKQLPFPGYDRNHYEIIPEGAVCKLYFDLEFKKSINHGRDGLEMVRILIKYVCHCLAVLYQVTCEESQVIQLDASTESKFSNHLIFILKRAVFKDNIHAGNFVHHIFKPVLEMRKRDEEKKENLQTLNSGLPNSSQCDEKKNVISPSKAPDIQERQLDEDENGKELEENVDFLKDFPVEGLSNLFVKDSNGGECLFCDMGVYTKNRNFRLYLSKKLGKNNPLVLSSNNTYKPHCTENQHHKAEKQLFLDSLISNISPSTNWKILTCNTRDRTKFQISSKPSGAERSPDSDLLDGYRSSPYSEVDVFIKTSAISSGGVQGAIRRWLYFAQEEKLIYEISNNRFCHNVGRQHKSNNVMIVADLKAGVYFQKCHDPECRRVNFKSQEWPLPASVLPAAWLEDERDEEEEEMDDEALLSVASQIEKAEAAAANAGQQQDHTTEFSDDDLDDDWLLSAVEELEQPPNKEYR